jgi:hypothetical protein
MGIVAGFRLVRDFVLCELTDRGLMNGREGASTAETGSPRKRDCMRPDLGSLSSLVSSERSSKDGGGGDRAEREDE